MSALFVAQERITMIEPAFGVQHFDLTQAALASTTVSDEVYSGLEQRIEHRAVTGDGELAILVVAEAYDKRERRKPSAGGGGLKS